jgi:hypothetical protein
MFLPSIVKGAGEKMISEQILRNAFFAYFHSIGDYWVAIWGLALYFVFVGSLIYLLTKR